MSNGTHTHVNAPEEVVQARMAPHDIPAEEGLLGSVLINPATYHEAPASLKPDDFFILRNSWIWEAMGVIMERGETIDELSLSNELKAKNRFDDIGGTGYLAYLTFNIGTSNNAETYGLIVLRAAIRRSIMRAGAEMIETAMNEDIDIDAVIDRSNKLVIDATERRTTKVRTLGEGLEKLVAKHADIASGAKEPDALKTRTLLDAILAGGGLRSGGWVVTADTSGGKSELTRNFLENFALQGFHVHYNSLEMNEEDVLTNSLSRFSGIPSDDLDSLGKPTDPAGLAKYDAGVVKMYEIEPYIHFDDTETVSVYQVMSSIRRSHREFGIKAAVVDYLELIEAEGINSEKDYLMIGEMFRRLRTLGRELGIPIIIPVQQNRSGMEGKKGIARSYDIVKHCDGLIYIKDADDKADNNGDEVIKLVSIEKQRRGKKGSRQMIFDFACHAVLEGAPSVISLDDLNIG